MTIEQKKEHVLRCVKLGMDSYSAYIVATCTVEEIALLDDDVYFQSLIEQQNKIAEYDLLKNHEVATRIAINRGNANPVQWRLEKLNPNKWGNGKGGDTEKTLPPGTIILVGEETDDNDTK